jgi:tetratricopeptide (TPR) repeat protein
VAAGRLRLLARRQGDRLTFQVNGLAPLEFQDLFPLTGTDPGVFGLEWPPGAAVEEVKASRQELPAAPSPLERGDDFYAAGRLHEALAAYQAAAGRDPEARLEARYKEGLCLAALKRADEAAAAFREVAGHQGLGGAGGRWTALADCQLWLWHLRAGRPAEADAQFEKVASTNNFRFDQLAAHLPEEVRDDILARYSALGVHFTVGRPEGLVRNFERAVPVQEFFQPNVWVRYTTRLGLMKAYWLAGREDDALRTVEALFRDLGYNPMGLEEYCWLLRRRGAAAQALAVVERFIADPLFLGTSGVVSRHEQVRGNLLVERARLHVALNDWAAAERDLDEFFARNDRTDLPAGGSFAAACLIQGFLRERRGDAAGAQAVWGKGLEKARLLPDDGTANPDPAALGVSGSSVIQHMILTSLTDRVTDQDAARYLSLLSSLAGTGTAAGKMARLMPVPPAVFKGMWRSPRGREWARRYAFRDLTFAEAHRVPAFLLVAEILRQGALPVPPSPEQDDLTWKLVEDTYWAFLDGTVREPHLLTVAFVWKGSPGIPGFSWQGLAPTLGPGLRGPLAYVFGHRYLRLGRPKEAADFFTQAAAAAPADSPPARLSRAELDKLKAR